MSENGMDSDAATRAGLSTWLKEHEHLAGWVEAIGVVAALFFGALQLRDARIALESAAEANQIALRGQVSDLMTQINQAALDHPGIAGEYVGIKRLHLMRLHYFFRAYNLYEEGIFDEQRFEAETRYLSWAAAQEDFLAVWDAFADQYPHSFQVWVNGVVNAKRARAATNDVNAGESALR